MSRKPNLGVDGKSPAVVAVGRRCAATANSAIKAANTTAAGGSTPTSPPVPVVANFARRVALVIGNGGYARVKALPNPPNDADTILAGLDDQVRTNILILDACRNNPLEPQVSSPAPSRSIETAPGLAAPTALGSGATLGAGTLIAFATARIPGPSPFRAVGEMKSAW